MRWWLLAGGLVGFIGFTLWLVGRPSVDEQEPKDDTVQRIRRSGGA